MSRIHAVRPDSTARKLALHLLALATLAVVSTFPLAARAESPATVKNKVIFQVSEADPAKWNLTLNNAKNVQSDLGKDQVEIEIVAYGPGIGMLKADSLVGNRVDDAAAAGVKIVACENTMKAQKLKKDDMLKSAAYVSAGVVELMQKQQQGYAYIRP